MDLFGRKKKKQQEEEEEQARIAEEEAQRKVSLENKKLKKKLKDLAPENSGKRREPVKPWGKKERGIVGFAFLVTTLAAMAMYLNSHEYKFPGLPKITFKGINFESPFGEKVIELGQKSQSSISDERGTMAIDKFNEYISPLGGFYGFAVIRLNEGVTYGVSSDRSFQGASMLKLPLMVLVYKSADNGSLDLGTEYKLKEEDKVKGSGSLSSKPAGSVFTYRQLVRLMGKESDRTAYKIMKAVVGDEQYRQFLYEIGMTNTDIDTGMTTPQDMANLLNLMIGEGYLTADSKNELLDSLTNTVYESWIPKGVPEGVSVAHKVGIDSGVVADGGIVESRNPYILVIMGQGITSQDADRMYPQFSKDIYALENDSE